LNLWGSSFDLSKGINHHNYNLLSEISNAESNEDDDEEETSLSSNEAQEEDIIETHGLWDFILTTSENEEEEEEEALPVSSRSKGPIDTTSLGKNQKSCTPSTKEKCTIKKNSIQTSDSSPRPLSLLLYLLHHLKL